MRSNTNTDLPYSCTLTTKLLKVRRRSYSFRHAHATVNLQLNGSRVFEHSRHYD